MQQQLKPFLQIKVATLKAKGEVISDEDQEKMLKDITDKYNEELSPYYAASRLWVDGIIDPLENSKSDFHGNRGSRPCAY